MTTHTRTPMPPLNLRWTIFGRSVKPVAFALMYSMLVISWAAYANVGVLDGSEFADILSGGALLVFGILSWGWWSRSQKLAELGLLLASIVWGLRFWLIVLVNTGAISTEGLWLSAGWAVIASGSYLLEKADANATRGF